MKILICGAAGQLGSYMVDKCLVKGHHVIGIDNLLSGKEENIEHHCNNNNFKFFCWDIRNDLKDFYDFDFDQIYNFACLASPPLYQQYPIGTIMTSILGTKNLLELARIKNAKFFFASSSEVYANPKESPQKETYVGQLNPLSIRNCYDMGKALGETLCYEYNRQYKTKVKVARIFNTVSERISPSDGRIISNFVKQALLGEDITIYGTGQQTRSILWIDDAIDAYWKLMNETNDEFIGPINIGADRELTVLEIARIIIELTNSKSKITFKPLPQDDPSRRKPDISLANNILGWYPNISLEEGLKKIIKKYFYDFKIKE